MSLLKGKCMLVSLVLTGCVYSLSRGFCNIVPSLPRHVSEYLKVQQRDPKAHRYLGQLYEREGDINKAVGCYKVGETSLRRKCREKPDLLMKQCIACCASCAVEQHSRVCCWS